jgi:hypothetical protein
MVEVYRNLMTKTWSVRENGIVIDHPRNIVLRNAKFVVRPGGRDRVRKERSKNVHAFVKGERAEHLNIRKGREVTYNPYVNDTFVYVDSGEPCLESDLVLMSGTRVWVCA